MIYDYLCDNEYYIKDEKDDIDLDATGLSIANNEKDRKFKNKMVTPRKT